MAGPGNPLRRGAGQDGRAAEGRRAGDHAAGARRGRRRPLRVPDEVRHDGRADEGILRRDRRPVAGAEPRRQARRHLLQHRHPGRRPGDHGADGGDPADAPRDGVRAGGVHVRGEAVRHGDGARRQPVRRRHVRRRRVEVAVGGGAGARLPPGQVLRRHRQEAQDHLLRLSSVPYPPSPSTHASSISYYIYMQILSLAGLPELDLILRNLIKLHNIGGGFD